MENVKASEEKQSTDAPSGAMTVSQGAGENSGLQMYEPQSYLGKRPVSPQRPERWRAPIPPWGAFVLLGLAT
ncbi:MAG: hypothetical protein HC925_07870 [Coleofasciculaceae cyanobacterium SM2_3_26]|nr:hypothetical protein [Coleofasciculaceae cyanobacterium SM2_3_26]